MGHLRQRFEEFKNVPAGHMQLETFQTLEFLHVQFPVQVSSTVELHWLEPVAHVFP